MFIKFIIAGAVGLVLYLGYQFITGLVDEKAYWQTEASKFQLANNTLSAKLNTIETDLKESFKRQDNLNLELQKTRLQMNSVVKLFSDNDFTKLVERKPTLITIKMQRATKKLFKEIEQITKNESNNNRKESSPKPSQ
jgi:hypothetical protein